MILLRCIGFAILLVSILTGQVNAHRPGESYIFLSVTDTEVTGRFEVTLRDLNKVISIDQNNDAELTDAEFFAVAEQASAYMQKTLFFHHGQQIHPVEVGFKNMRHTGVGNFAQIEFTIPTLEGVPEGMRTTYQFLFDGPEPTHRGLLVIENNTLAGIVDAESNIAGIFGPHDNDKYIRLSPLAGYEVIVEFIKHGAWHIWIGLDHILFIISLLLLSVMVVKDGQREPVKHFAEAMWAVVTIITLFTISHSISLTLAALDIVRLPSRLVESVIAASIAVAALHNLFPVYIKHMGALVFFFGLFHGFGFANVLAPLTLQTSSLVPSLFGFNVGVELGQLAIICMVFPLLFLLRNWRGYDTVVLKIGSIGLITISSLWFVKRAFGL